MAGTKISDLATASTIVSTASTTLSVVVQGGATKQTPISKIINQKYEAGTYVPSFIGVSAPSYSTQLGEYVFIGDFVQCSIRLNYTGLDTSDGSDISVTLPATVSTSILACNGSMNATLSTGFAIATTSSVIVNINTSGQITLQKPDGVEYTYDGGEIATSGAFYLSLSYIRD